MSGGLDKIEWEILRKYVIAPLVQSGLKIFLFGSRARETHSRFSDVDLIVEGDKSRLIGQVQNAIEESRFPYKVDLVLEKDLADSYRAQVNRDKKSIHFLPDGSVELIAASQV